METQKSKQNSDNGDVSRPWGAFIALFFGAIIVSIMTWFGAQYYGEQMARFYVTNEAKSWSERVLDNLNHKEKSFAESKLSTGDKYIVKDFYSGTNMYRAVFVNAKGKIFWSTRANEKGNIKNWDAISPKLKKGITNTKFQSVSPEQIVGLTLTSRTELAKSYGMNHNNKHTIVEIAIPVFVDNKLAGSMILFKNITGSVVWMVEQSKKVATALFAILLLVFAAIAFVIWKYSASRNKHARLLRQAKTESDVAERESRAMADQLQIMNDDIASLNTELNNNMKTLRETQDEVIRKGKMAQLGQLTATVAHDIRNPLGSVRTSAFLLRRKFASETPAMAKPLDRIEKGVERCDSIISELLDFARSKDLQTTEQNLDEWMVSLVQEQAALLPANVAVECELGLDEREVAFDADSLRRALINFISNASEAMVGKGNEKPAFPTQNPVIRVSSKQNNDRIEISVSDNGPGISEENKNRILDPLFTTKSFGVGLGLPAVEKIFEQHGGGLDISSVEGQGATFTGWIPINNSNAKTAQDEAA